MYSKIAVEQRPEPELARKTAPSSIVSALSLRLVLLTAALLGLMSVCVYFAMSAHQVRAQERLLTLKVNKLTETSLLLLRPGDDRFATLLQNNAARRPGTRLELFDADGNVFYADPLAEPHQLSVHQRTRSFSLRSAQAGAPVLHGSFTIDVAQDVQLARSLREMLALATLIGAALAGALSMLAVRHGLRPLDRLAAQTEAMSRSAMPGHLALEPSSNELSPLVANFNQLMSRLRSSREQLEAFNADVAHELRTPLTTLIGKTELALSRPRGVEELTGTLVSNLETLRRIGTLINDMLFLARADGGDTARLGRATSLRALIQDMLDYHEPVASERQLTIEVQGDLVLAVDEPLLLRALANLLGNAMRYASPGTVVTVLLETQDEVPQLGVRNVGPQVAPADLPRLFDRLYRADVSRTRHGANFGLGLAIVAAIARMHGGRTWARSDSNCTVIGITLAPPQARNVFEDSASPGKEHPQAHPALPVRTHPA
ncbi:heavy metal sensor histidine kinase [Variovorax sp. MHTC-1]|uniref:heavy metal sensor histidine kinase n=1 Tax=Variovorax sp. MHTC-1 TaxID=2495593 RepID=UPI000F862A73|nr:heavy metal sensor histidine kinase [Variovorax sp. MHTC-1]RST48160.1 HAMP domain-containing protein [Variovorax sp. MHTC-1]